MLRCMDGHDNAHNDSLPPFFTICSFPTVPPVPPPPPTLPPTALVFNGIQELALVSGLTYNPGVIPALPAHYNCLGNVQFKKLKHSSNSTNIFASEANGNNSTQNGGHQSTRDRANIATKLIPATNSPRVELGLVLSNNVDREPSPGSLTADGIGTEGEGKLKKGNAEHNVNEILPSESSLSNGRTIGTVKGGGKRLLSALFPGRRKGRLGISFSEPRLNFDVELPKNGFGFVEVDDENIVGNGGQCEDHQQSFGERNRLCEGTSDDAHKGRSHFAGAIQKVREKLHVRSAPISNKISASSSLHRSNTTPIPFSMRDSNDRNFVTNKKERADVLQQPIEGKVLAKLRKQAKIMDIVMASDCLSPRMGTALDSNNVPASVTTESHVFH
uniref:Uncharacterized protein n=1 Tax=Globodera rostochiensis TaxID=31243 RepID=A0A914HAQ8_GLORO